MVTRRRAISSMALGSLATSMHVFAGPETYKRESNFRYCLNTSTISARSSGLMHSVEIASKAGYDGVEVWVRDVRKYLDSGNSAASLKSYIDDLGISVENAIGFAPWLAEGETGLRQMEEEMSMLGEIGCKRIAAPPAGVNADQPLDLFMAGKKYRELLDLGRRTGVMPQLEFWGASPVLWHLGQVLMIAAIADDPDVRILPDAYHMFRGGSGFDVLKMLDGSIIEVFHMNDYPDSKAREEQVDADRVYPGDGVAPLKRILNDLRNMGGVKVLSLELFNQRYWEEDPFHVAKTGLQKMKSLAGTIP